MFSAVKINGKRLHELARAGKEVERKARKVHIYDIQLIDYNEVLLEPTFTIKVRCSKGTYIRTLGVDIGQKLGYPAHLSSLVRTKSGPFTLENSVTFEELEEWSEQDWEERLFPIDSALVHLPQLTLEAALVERVKYGQSLILNEKVEPSLYRIYDQSRNFIALYEGIPERLIKPRKVFLL